MPQNDEFFAVRSEQSEIKTKIVLDYFSAWTRVIKKWNTNMGYIDLFCGPGVYGDNTESSPLIILRKVLEDSFLSSKMYFHFNDEDEDNISQLKKNINFIDRDGKLRDRIVYTEKTIEGEYGKRIQIEPNMPILSFIDPFGYKGLTIELIDKLIANNGSDCIFFFNYNRINMAFNNPKFNKHIESLFGIERAERIRNQLNVLAPAQREILVLGALTEALIERRSKHVLSFKFYSTNKLRTSHFIMFATKNPIACSIMKQIMYSNSAKDPDGVAKYAYEDKHNFDYDLTSEQLTFLKPPLQELKEQLQSNHQGQTVEIGELCRQYNQDYSTCFVGANVKEALRQLEECKKVLVSGRTRLMSRGKISMPDGATVRFL